MRNILLPFVVNKVLKINVLEFIDSSFSKNWIVNTTAGTKNRKFCKISELQHLKVCKEIEEFKFKCYESIGIKDPILEPIFGDFIGINMEGGNVHKHTDPTNEHGWFHTRINCLIQKPFDGGMPIIENILYQIEEDQCWYNNASLWSHGSTVVRGLRDRIVLSLGTYVSLEDFNNINTNVLGNTT